MTHTESAPVKVDGHGITDPSRVVVEEVPDKRNEVQVPVTPTPPAPVQADAQKEETVQTAPVAMAAAPVTPVVHATSAQVSAQLADKKAEEFRGRVVKLRDEVDQLNRRLDEIKK